LTQGLIRLPTPLTRDHVYEWQHSLYFFHSAFNRRFRAAQFLYADLATGLLNAFSRLKRYCSTFARFVFSHPKSISITRRRLGDQHNSKASSASRPVSIHPGNRIPCCEGLQPRRRCSVFVSFIKYKLRHHRYLLCFMACTHACRHNQDKIASPDTPVRPAGNPKTFDDSLCRYSPAEVCINRRVDS